MVLYEPSAVIIKFLSINVFQPWFPTQIIIFIRIILSSIYEMFPRT